MTENPPDYDAVEAELGRLLDDLKGASSEVVAAETERLRALAEQVEDERGRERARYRAASLPRLLAGPPKATSEQFHQAQVLFARAIDSEGPAQARIPLIERAIAEIGALATQAPHREAGAIRRMNSPLSRLLDHLEKSAE
ncbi:hypothetical protein [Kribbella sp. CA-293567]|uniref:hypothetical protein n=1 Tax=Kribbella sp. CA-293567 TaxID=3002436 RepID=UPI0022DE11C5|nr:hypothetical protein [Kribbella sp. CA-293567]WBQ06400.1 hypothetical protein OX958_06320 [Kribbella sp. CA-293567]